MLAPTPSRALRVRGTPSGAPARDTHDRAAPGERSWPGFPSAWTELSRTIERCERCPLHRSRTHAVVYRGSPAPAVVFVGEAPGAEEDRQGLPFVGRSGTRLDRAIDRLGLPGSTVGILNVLKCRPPQNRFDPSAARSCRPYLERQLELLRPRVLVTLGAHALRALDPEAPKVTEAAGAPRRWRDTPLFPLLHPAAALHAPRYRTRWEEDIGALARFLAALGEPITERPVAA